jgi:hypothetical protein
VSLLAVCCLYKIIQETACELIPGAFISIPTGKRKLCRHEHRLEENCELDCKEVIWEDMNRIALAYNRVCCLNIVIMEINLYVHTVAFCKLLLKMRPCTMEFTLCWLTWCHDSACLNCGYATDCCLPCFQIISLHISVFEELKKKFYL